MIMIRVKKLMSVWGIVGYMSYLHRELFLIVWDNVDVVQVAVWIISPTVTYLDRKGLQIIHGIISRLLRSDYKNFWSFSYEFEKKVYKAAKNYLCWKFIKVIIRPFWCIAVYQLNGRWSKWLEKDWKSVCINVKDS